MLGKCQCSKSKRPSPKLNRKYGVDLDGVCYNFVGPFSSWLKENLRISYSDNEIVDYHWYNCIPGLSEQDFWNEFHRWGKAGSYRDLDLLPGARDGVLWLMDNGVDVYFITARPEYAKEQTIESLEKHFPLNRDKLIFADGSKGKVKEVNELGIDVIIEDAPHNANLIVEKTPAGVYLVDTSYNQDIRHPRIKRVSHWDEIVSMEKKQ